MSAKRKPTRHNNSRRAWQTKFEEMLPTIRSQARFAFRRLGSEAKDDAIQEVIANSCVAYHRLWKQRRAEVANATSLAGYAIRQFYDCRRTGNQRRISDVLSPYCWKKKGVKVERLDRFDPEEEQWIEAIVPDDSRPVPEQAAFRIDFPAWLATYTRRKRKIAEALAMGERTTDVARRFKLSKGRISQLRRQFFADWRAFHGENNGDDGHTAAA